MQRKLSLLFVDDEPRILSGLRRLLRSLRHEWDMRFAEGGARALEMLEAEPADVVVSDMRMPGMTGVELLRAVRQHHPQTVRMALSGQAAKEMVLESVGLVHQYHAKPCDAETLKATLAAVATHLQGVDDDLRRYICGLDAVVSDPAVYAQLLAAARADQAVADELGALVTRDVAAAARVMQLVSSAFFARPLREMTPAEAAGFLGADILKPLVECDGGFRPPADGAGHVDIPALCTHSLAVAHAAAALAEAETADRKTADLAFTAGLLHDIGVLVLAERNAAEAAGAEPAETDPAHPPAGALLLGLWGLHESIVRAVAAHHEPAGVGEEAFSVLTAVHVADVVAHQAGLARPGAPAREVDAGYLASIGSLEKIGPWQQLCRQAAGRALQTDGDTSEVPTDARA